MHHGVRVCIFFRRSTTAETTAAAAHLGVTTYIFFLILLVFVPGTFLRVLYNIHHSFRTGWKEKKKRAGPTSSTCSAVAATAEAAAAEASSSSSSRIRSSRRRRKHERTSTYTGVRDLFRFVFSRRKNCTYSFRSSTSRLSNTRPTELLVPGATTSIPTADPPRPPVSRAGLTAVVSHAACLRDTVHMVHVRSANL